MLYVLIMISFDAGLFSYSPISWVSACPS